uniref:insulin-induced gene 2 protein-like isoform X1 n=2 Tax=Myxine glutinosa TaxID=7769 RepID=UPI0035901489
MNIFCMFALCTNFYIQSDADVREGYVPGYDASFHNMVSACGRARTRDKSGIGTNKGYFYTVAVGTILVLSVHMGALLWPPGGPSLVSRILLLFLVGVLLALVLDLLHIQRRVVLFPPEVVAGLCPGAWWLPLCCGSAAVAIGLLYPCMDRCLGEPHRFKREWSSVLRCVAVFMGIYHASAKIDFANNGQLLLTLAALSVGLWWMFDRSCSGLGLGIGIAAFATLTTQILLSSGVFQSVLPDILYVHSSLPCIFFAGGITIGNIGRQLALGKQHAE